MLQKETHFEYQHWTDERLPKLKLETWGRTRFNEEEIILEDCTVEQIVTLFEYKAEDKEQKEDGHHQV